MPGQVDGPSEQVFPASRLVEETSGDDVELGNPVPAGALPSSCAARARTVCALLTPGLLRLEFVVAVGVPLLATEILALHRQVKGCAHQTEIRLSIFIAPGDVGERPRRLEVF